MGLAERLLAATLLPGVATAIGPPVGGCPNGGGRLLTPTFLWSAGDNGHTGDENADTWACRKPNPGRGGYTWKENSNPCPSSSAPT